MAGRLWVLTSSNGTIPNFGDEPLSTASGSFPSSAVEGPVRRALNALE